MANLKDLWRKRYVFFLKEVGKYGRLIFNDHFSLILLFIFGFGAYYYRQQFVRLQAVSVAALTLPLVLLVGLIYLLLFRLGQPIQLMKAADQAYLFARGHAWHSYWKKGLVLGWGVPAICLLVASILLFPFIVLVSGWSQVQLIWFCLVPLILKALLDLQTYLAYYGLGIMADKHWVLELGAAILMVGFSFLPQPWNWLVVGCLSGGIGLVSYKAWRRIGQSPIHFEAVIEQDLARTNRFYKWIAIFADVPRIVPPIKRRAWLDPFIHLCDSLVKGNRFGYAYLRLLLRHTAYSGIWARVMTFVMVLIVMIDQVYVVMGLGVLGYLMTVIQLVPLLTYYEGHPLQSIYPIQGVQRITAFKRVLLLVFLIQTLAYALVAAFSLASLVEWALVVGVWLVTLLLCGSLYIDFWAKKNLKA